MPLMRRAALVLLASLGTVALVGCVPEVAVVTNLPATTATAESFPREEEALSAANLAISGYYKTADTILNENGEGGDRLAQFATEQLVNVEATGFQKLREKNLDYSGWSVVESVALQSFESNASFQEGVVVAYVCIDMSQVSISYPDGTSFIPPERPDRYPLEVVFDLAPKEPGVLLVSAISDWEGAGVCL